VKKTLIAGALYLLLLTMAVISAERPAVQPRFVLLIDMSASMGRKQATTLRTVRALVRSGFNGQIRSGEYFAIWAMEESLRADFFPNQQWTDKDARLLAEVTAQAIETEPHGGRGHPAIYQRVIDALPKTDPVTVIFITDQILKGTVFDSELGRYYASHSSQILRERKAFVTAMAFEQGKAVSFADSISGDTLDLPPRPMPPEISESPAGPSNLTLNSVPSPQPQSEPKLLTDQRHLEKPVPATPLQTEKKVTAVGVAEKMPAAPPVPMPASSLPRNDAAAVPDVPSYILSPPPEPPKNRVIAAHPAEKESRNTAVPVNDPKTEPNVISAPSDSTPKTAMINEKPPVPGSFFGFANILYLGGAFAILGWIAWRFFAHSSGKENRSLISRSMDSRR
jgi:hypothetical protein